MPPKKQMPDRYPPLSNQTVHGWSYRVNGQGLVTVGTHADGPFMRWTFRLTRYPDEDAADPAACVLAEIEDRRRSERASKIGQMTPRFGPLAAEEICSKEATETPDGNDTSGVRRHLHKGKRTK